MRRRLKPEDATAQSFNAVTPNHSNTQKAMAQQPWLFFILGSDSGAQFIPHRRQQVKANITRGPIDGSKNHNPPSEISCPPFSLIPLFPLGQIVATPGALSLLEQHGVSATALLRRHVRGDWGDLGRADGRTNDEAVQNGGRIFSTYPLKSEKVWTITEATGEDGVSRASTCLLLPSEY